MTLFQVDMLLRRIIDGTRVPSLPSPIQLIHY